MIASLPMYDRTETASANDRLWQAIRKNLGYGPDALTRDGNVWDIWQSPDLLLAQTCGMPFRTRLHGKVSLIGTPDYQLAGCPAGYYNSVFVVHRDAPIKSIRDLDGVRFAYNEPLSQSGWAAPKSHVDELGLKFGETVQSGAHRASAEFVAAGKADAGALDALSWELIRRYDGFASNLREVGRTSPTPVLPFITAQGRDIAALFDAIAQAIDEMSDSDRQILHLHGLVQIDEAAYLAVPTPAAP